jgi:hypothetical protein
VPEVSIPAADPAGVEPASVDVDLSSVDDFGMVVATHAISMPKVTNKIVKRSVAFMIFTYIVINAPKSGAFC